MKKSWLKNLIDTMEIDSNTVSMFKIDLPEQFKDNHTDSIFGIDPGYRHFGFSVFLFDHAICYEVKCKDFSDQIDRSVSLQELIVRLIELTYKNPTPDVIIMEGSSHAEKFGQTSLAEARLSLALGASNYGIVKFVPPSTIRKGVFGKGNIRGEDYWKNELPPNAAASLTCAIFGSKLYQKENT